MALGLSAPDRPNRRLRIATAAYGQREGDLFYVLLNHTSFGHAPPKNPEQGTAMVCQLMYQLRC